MYVVKPVPSGFARNVLGASFAPVGSVTVWTMSTPDVEVGNPANWSTKVEPRAPRTGTAVIVGAAFGGAGGGGAGAWVTGAGVGAGLAIGAGVALAAPPIADARGVELDEFAVDSGVTSQAADASAAKASAAIRFRMRPR